MKRNLSSGYLCVCLLAAVALPGFAQDQPASTPTTNAAAAPPPPREAASDVNSGRGLSVEPIYWMTNVRGGIRKGSKSASSSPGTVDYTSSPKDMVGAMITVPAGKTNAVRVTYLATRNYANGSTFAPTALSLFGTDIGNGDPLAVSYKLTNIKMSYDFLTYFFKRGNTDFRVKTLWEFQYFSVNNSIIDFIPLSDGTFSPAAFAKDRSIISPTFGVGLEHTISRHVRWEAKASAFALPHRTTLIDSEASVALRFGRIELLGGGKLYHFKSKVQNDNFVSGDVYGPYAGVRFYWKKQ
ncbi:MAG: hypothetical protein ABL995_20550 [Bryobacteraceae bacterium]